MTDLLLKGIARIRMTTKAIFTLYRRAFRADTKGYPVWYQWTPFRYATLPFKRSAQRSLASFPYDPTTATSIKSSLKDRLRILFNHFAIILSRSVTKKKETFFWNWWEGAGPSSDSGLEYIALPFPSSKKLTIWSFQVVVVQGRQRNSKKAWCTCRAVVLLTEPTAFWRYRCRRRHRHSFAKCLPDSRRYHRSYVWKEALSCIRFCSGAKAIGCIECEHRWSVDEVKRFIYIGKLSHLQKLLFITSNERLIIQSGRIVKHLAEKSTIHSVKVYWFR